MLVMRRKKYDFSYMELFAHGGDVGSIGPLFGAKTCLETTISQIDARKQVRTPKTLQNRPKNGVNLASSSGLFGPS